MFQAISHFLFLLFFLSLSPVAVTLDLVEHTVGETILCLGDSLTHGMYVTPDDETGQSSHPYSLQLTKSLKSATTVIEAGTNGATLTDMLATLPSLLRTHDPLVVIILGGTNDLGRGGVNATHDHMLGRLAQLHKLALNHIRADKKKVITIAITIPPVDGHDEDVDATRIKVCERCSALLSCSALLCLLCSAVLCSDLGNYLLCLILSLLSTLMSMK
jgi:hypothetical protein